MFAHTVFRHLALLDSWACMFKSLPPSGYFFGLQTVWTKIRTDRKLVLIWIQNGLTTHKVFLVEFLEKVNYEKSQQKTTNALKLLSIQRAMS